MKHKVIENISLENGESKQFIWYSDDYEMVKNYFESRMIDEVLNVSIDDKITPLKEADKIILDWESQHLTNKGNML